MSRNWDGDDANLEQDIEMKLESSSPRTKFHPSLEPDGDERSAQLVSDFARRKRQQQRDVPLFSFAIGESGIKMSWGTVVITILLIFAAAYATFMFTMPLADFVTGNSSESERSDTKPNPTPFRGIPKVRVQVDDIETEVDSAELARVATIPVDVTDSLMFNPKNPPGKNDSSSSAGPTTDLYVPCPTCEQVCGNVNPFAAAVKAGHATSIVYSPAQISPLSKRHTSESASFQGELNRLFSDRPTPFMRWEDPEEYAIMRKHEGRWTDGEARMFAVTAEPIKYDSDEKKNLMKYDPVRFRQLNIPILWGDSTDENDLHFNAHVHWNAAAEKRFMQLMRKQQFPDPPVDCTKQKYLILDQWASGFFSRYNIGMEMLWRASNVMDRMVIIGFGPMGVGGASIQSSSHDDFAGQGITQYFAPSSQCSDHPYVLRVLQMARSGPAGFSDMTKAGYPALTNFAQIQPGGALFNHQFVHMCEDWCEGHNSHGAFSPYRRILFDPRVDPDNYEQDLWRELETHPIEHIYSCDTADCRKAPMDQGAFQGTHEMRHRLWTEFTLIMMSGFYFQLSPRIHVMRNLVADFWTTQMLRKQNIYPTNENTEVAYYAEGERKFAEHEAAGTLRDLDPNVQLHPLSNSAAIFVRRGDKCPDDPYCVRTGKFRGIGLFLQGVYQEELRRGKQFDSIFVMSDDGPALDALLREINGEDQPVHDPVEVFKIIPRSTKEELEAAMATRDDMIISRAFLKGRWVTHNQLAPASCFQPSKRQGFEGFLVSLSYMMHYASFMVGHESSNVFWMVGRVIYGQNQLDGKTKRTGVGAKVVNVADDFKVY